MSPYSIVKNPPQHNTISNNFVSRKNYYSKPSFHDVQLEERNYQLAASYNGSSFYEWNIDGMNEYQIINLVKVMLRPNCESHYWKEKFIFGSPALFAEKVRQKIRNIYNKWKNSL